jgi:hypothetical protein
MIESALGREKDAQVAIARMRDHYAASFTAARAAASPELFYPGLNLIVAGLAARAPQAMAQALDATLVADVRASIEAKVRDDPDFWSVAAGAELLLLEAVAAGNLADKLADVKREFADLQRRISTPSEWRSVYDTERFVLERWASAAGPKEAKACNDLIQQLAGFAWPVGA